MKRIFLCLLLTSGSASAADFCRHQDAADVLDQFFFSTAPGTEELLAFFTAENEKQRGMMGRFDVLERERKNDPEAMALVVKARGKFQLSVAIEEELRCRLGP